VVLVTDPARIAVLEENPQPTASQLIDIVKESPQQKPSRRTQEEQEASQRVAPQPQVTRAPSPCPETQALWQQVAAALRPRLNALSACLGQGTPGCQDDLEGVAAGLFNLQQVERRLEAACP
jgi:hypothetical protein